MLIAHYYTLATLVYLLPFSACIILSFAVLPVVKDKSHSKIIPHNVIQWLYNNEYIKPDWKVSYESFQLPG